MIQDPIAIVILLGSFVVLILMRTPIAFALGFSSIFTALYSDIDLVITEAGTATWYLILVMPNGTLVASDAIAFTA
jgi:hypothetical protein